MQHLPDKLDVIRSQNLLDKLDVVRLKLENTYDKDNFNIFRILRNESDEVHLHSRFIYELLNPNGSHGLGTVFIKLFIEVCNLPAINYSQLQVLREHSNIDILIQDNQNAIIIENKIYAIDQHEQLKRYQEYATKSYRKPKLVYLTLHGKEPTSWSKGDMQDKIHLISYAQEIDQWITSCIKECAVLPTMRETLIQYKSLIKHLTGENMNENEKQEVLALMSQNNNAECAAILVKNWQHVRWHTEYYFWNTLLNLVNKTYDISNNELFSKELISKAIYGNRNRIGNYGILYSIGTLDNVDIYSKIERGLYCSIHYGLKPLDVDFSLFTNIKDYLQELGTELDKFWLCKKYHRDIDFERFNDSDSTLQLANPKEGELIITDLWKTIEILNTKFVNILQKEFSQRFIPKLKVNN